MQPVLKYVMTYWERIAGPMKSTKGSAFGEKICWQIIEATYPTSQVHPKAIV